MQTKKDPKVNLEPRKVTYVLIGLVTTLALLFVALEWSNSTIRRSNILTRVADTELDEDMIITVQNQMTPPPPPPPMPEVIENFDIVDEDVDIEDYEVPEFEDTKDVLIEVVSLDAAPSEGEETIFKGSTEKAVEEAEANRKIQEAEAAQADNAEGEATEGEAAEGSGETSGDGSAEGGSGDSNG